MNAEMTIKGVPLIVNYEAFGDEIELTEVRVKDSEYCIGCLTGYSTDGIIVNHLRDMAAESRMEAAEVRREIGKDQL